jgi:hypothetical protein
MAWPVTATDMAPKGADRPTVLPVGSPEISRHAAAIASNADLARSNSRRAMNAAATSWTPDPPSASGDRAGRKAVTAAQIARAITAENAMAAKKRSSKCRRFAASVSYRTNSAAFSIIAPRFVQWQDLTRIQEIDKCAFF